MTLLSIAIEPEDHAHWMPVDLGFNGMDTAECLVSRRIGTLHSVNISKEAD